MREILCDMGNCASCGSGNGKPKGCKNNGYCESNTCNKLTAFDWLANIAMPSHLMPFSIVEVRFKNDRKSYFDNVNNIPLSIGDWVAVEATSGHDIGMVTLTGELVRTQLKIKNIKAESVQKLYRKANTTDVETWKNYKDKEDELKLQARKMATSLKLKMKICDVEFQGDGSKATFYYSSEGRVDFRELIKQFASQFKTKIDMRQIGFRQESAKVGGIGSCGRELCCSTWLTDFRSVNTAAARYQQLSINPQKLAGQCGKLKCCLNYELDSYLDALKDIPSINTFLLTEKGKAKCIKIDVFRRKMWFAYEDSFVNWYDFSVDEVITLMSENRAGKTLPNLDEYKKEKESNVQSVDLISENSLERFEKKSAKKKPQHHNKTINSNQQKQNQNVKSNYTAQKNNQNQQKQPQNASQPQHQAQPKNNQNQAKKNRNHKNKPKSNPNQ